MGCITSSSEYHFVDNIAPIKRPIPPSNNHLNLSREGSVYAEYEQFFPYDSHARYMYNDHNTDYLYDFDSIDLSEAVDEEKEKEEEDDMDEIIKWIMATDFDDFDKESPSHNDNYNPNDCEGSPSITSSEIAVLGSAPSVNNEYKSKDQNGKWYNVFWRFC